MTRETGPRTGARTASVAVIGSGNIGTDLMEKVLRLSKSLRMGAVVGIDPSSEGLARATRMKVATTHDGIEGLLAMPEFADIKVIFDATSARAHERHAEIAHEYGKLMVDLTPAAIGPFVVPSVNLDEHLHADNVNMVTCGGQATIRWSRPSRGWRRWPTPRSSRPSLEIGGAGDPREHRRVHRDDQ